MAGGSVSARTVTITPDGSVIVIKGWKVAELARQGGLKPTYSGSVGGWALDAKRLPNLIAWLEYRNVRYDLKGANTVRAADDLSTAVKMTSEMSPEGLW